MYCKKKNYYFILKFKAKYRSVESKLKEKTEQEACMGACVCTQHTYTPPFTSC